MALRFGDLAYGPALWLFIRHALLLRYAAGGGLTSPRGITAARPPFFILRVVARPLGFIDMSDLKRLRCLLEPCFEFFNFPKTAAEPSASESLVGVLTGSWELWGES